MDLSALLGALGNSPGKDGGGDMYRKILYMQLGGGPMAALTGSNPDQAFGCNGSWMGRPTKTAQLFEAIAAGDDEGKVGLMLDRHAAPDAVTGDGKLNTPLHLACAHKNEDAVMYLLSYGATANPRNADGKTPLDMASGHDGICDELREHMQKKNPPVDPATELGSWQRKGVPPTARFARSLAELAATEEDGARLEAAIAAALDVADDASAAGCKLRGNSHVRQKDFASAERAYTAGLAAICAINKLCTALPPPRAQNKGPNSGPAPQDVQEWNFFRGGAPDDNGRMLVFGRALHARHPLVLLRTALLSNRALCYLQLDFSYSATRDCSAVLEVDPSHKKALYRFSLGWERVAKLERERIEQHHGTKMWQDACGPVPAALHMAPADRLPNDEVPAIISEGSTRVKANQRRLADAAPFACSRHFDIYEKGLPVLIRLKHCIPTPHRRSEKGCLAAAKDAALLLFKMTNGKNKAFADRAVYIYEAYETRFGVTAGLGMG